MKNKLSVYLFWLGLALGVSGAAQATAMLTAAATAAGYGLSTFVDEVPATGFCCGPLGILNTPGGIMVTNYLGDVKIFSDVDGHHWSDVGVAASYGSGNAVDLTRGPDGKIYMTQQAAGTVVQIKDDGTFDHTVVTGIPTATGIAANPVSGLLYVTDCCTTGSDIWEVDPAGTKTLFASPGGTPDGVTVSPDGSTLYVSLDGGGKILGYHTGTKAITFDSGPISGGPDGTALGSGILAGKIYANTNGGDLIEIDLATKAQTVLVTGGSRGDFIGVDVSNGSLLFTQTDRVLRLTAPTGGCFGSACNPAPEPSELSLLFAASLAMFAIRRYSVIVESL
jgi:hypothetical protein